jgi:hypothetical protein
LKVPLPYRPTGVTAERLVDGVRIRWNAAFDCDGNPVDGYHIYRAATAAGPFSRINAELVTDTVYDDLDMGVGVLSGAGASGYYVVSSVDSTGTESVHSLAVEPAATAPEAPEAEPNPEAEPDAAADNSGSNALSGCFISSAAGLTVNGQAVVIVMVVFIIYLDIMIEIKKESSR